MIKEPLAEKKLANYLEEGAKGNFRYTSLSPIIEFNETEQTCEAELFRVGSWEHPQAPEGMFSVTKKRITSWIKNFQEKICGPELPLDFGHRQDSRETPGWIYSLYEKAVDGAASLWASIRITDPAVWEKLKNGSLKYISPRVCQGYVEPASGKEFDVIRDASLTNWPYLKNLEPIALNFEEIENAKEGDRMKYEDLTLDLDLEEEETEEVQLAEKKVKIPKITLPPEIKKLPKDQQKAYKVAFATAYEKSKDVEKAKKVALKKVAKLEEEEEENMDTEFETSFWDKMKKAFGGKKEPEKEETTLEEVMEEVSKLRTFKQDAEFKEDRQIVETMQGATPVVKQLFETLLNSREVIVEFTEGENTVKKPMRQLVIQLIKELKSIPSVNLFERKSDETRNKVNAEMSEKANAYIKEHPGVSFREAMTEVYRQEHPENK